MDVVDGVADRLEVLEVLVFDAEPDGPFAERLLKRLDEFDQRQRVGVEIVDERLPFADRRRFDLEDVGEAVTHDLEDLVALEWACKLAALALCLGAYVYLALTVKGTPLGLILAVPAVFGVLWATSAKITHRMPYFKVDVFWSAVVLVFGLLPAIGMFASALLVRAAPGNALTALALAIPFWFLSRGVLLLGRRLDRWKHARIARRAALTVPIE